MKKFSVWKEKETKVCPQCKSEVKIWGTHCPKCFFVFSKFKCPRCGKKSESGAKRCDSCNLLFSKLQHISNSKAKMEMKNKRKNFTFMSTLLPKDVNKWKLFAICLFVGIFGVHRFKVGRWISAAFMLVCGVIVLAIVSLHLDMLSGYTYFMSFFSIFGGVWAFMWAFDCVGIAFGKFKVPVALKLMEEEKK